MSAEKVITVALYDWAEERTVAQCGPFATVEAAQEFADEHRGRLGITENLRLGYLPLPESFVQILDRREARHASMVAPSPSKGQEPRHA